MKNVRGELGTVEVGRENPKEKGGAVSGLPGAPLADMKPRAGSTALQKTRHGLENL